jgi:multidrug efflux pump subunit AcrA (membrane-fusion protein)
VELFVKQFQEVNGGDLLFRVDSPDWHIIQHELGEAVSDISLAEAGVQVALASYEEAEQSSEFLQERVNNLEKANVRRADLDAELLKSKKTVARLNAELVAARASLKGARLHLSVMLNTASSTADIPRETLSRTVKNSSDEEVPFWQTVNKLDVYAESDGIVDELFVTNGSWVEQGVRVMRAVDPEALRFRADAPQTDIQYYKNGQNVLIVPSEGASINLQKTMGGTLIKGYRADSQQRTLPLYVVPETIGDWAAPGVSAYMEVLIRGDDRLQMAAPLSCIVRDGLVDIFFRRDPRNPDFVIRTEADLGENDGRWVVLRSGVRVGDEIVMNGAYQLKLAGVGKAPSEAGHFHADGTWHAAEH